MHLYFKQLFFIKVVFLVITLLFSLELRSQPDTLIQETANKKHSPTTATIMSAVFPGLGQVYNKKYWKVPIIYAGAGAFLYFANWNDKFYQEYKQDYIYRTDDDSTTVTNYPFVSDAGILDQVNKARKYRDMNYIFLGGLYLLNIIDAAVDAHFFDYDISDDLSLKIKPHLYAGFSGEVTAGLSFRLQL